MRYQIIKNSNRSTAAVQSHGNVLDAINNFVRQMEDMPGTNKTVDFNYDGLIGLVYYDGVQTVLELVDMDVK